MNITNEQLNKILELASMNINMLEREVTEKDITEALVKIERKIQSFSSEIKVESFENKKILIADDLELSIYQLTTLLKRIGVVPYVARTKEEAVSEIKKMHFDCVIVDLFIPSSDDGIELIKTALERRKEINNDGKIVVISGTDDKSLIETCYTAGADLYISKDNEWHTKLLKYLSSSFLDNKNTFFSSFIINSNITCYVLKKFNDKKIFDEMIRNIDSAILSGTNNIIFDLKDINIFDSDNAYIFAEIYKMIAESNGKLVLACPSQKVRDALSFAYLEDIIAVTNSVEDAVSVILN